MYQWILSLHLIAVVTWLAALFYLPRLFAYHADARDRGETQVMAYFLNMERRLYKGIMLPSMIVAVVFGGLLLYLVPGFMDDEWFYAKLLLVAGLIGYHHVCLAYLKQFAAERCHKSATFFRAFNGIPTLLLVVIILLVVLKPF